jgi:hypothetical protein
MRLFKIHLNLNTEKYQYFLLNIDIYIIHCYHSDYFFYYSLTLS